MNHLWLVTFKTTDAKRKLLAAKELDVKGGKCYILDPNLAEVRMNIHWIAHHVFDDIVRRALEGYGKIEEIMRDVWRVGQFRRGGDHHTHRPYDPEDRSDFGRSTASAADRWGHVPRGGAWTRAFVPSLKGNGARPEKLRCPEVRQLHQLWTYQGQLRASIRHGHRWFDQRGCN